MLAVGAVLWTVALLSALQSPQPAPANQPLPEANALILGRVVDAGSGRPVSGAIVTLSGGVLAAGSAAPGPAPTPRAMTNASGQFVFRKLLKGAFTLTASKPGYAEGGYGRRRPGGTVATLRLDAGERVSDVVIPLWRCGSIAGSVTDEAGEPLIGVQVRAFQNRYVGGRRKLTQAGNATTDDRGLYRFGSLTPGDYIVAFIWHEVTLPASVVETLRQSANPGDPARQAIMREQAAVGGFVAFPGSPWATQVGNLVRAIDPSAPVPPAPGDTASVFIYPTMFYPTASSAARAAVITIGSGQERGNVDFALQPVRALRVTGTLVGADGPAAHVAVRLVPAADDFQASLDASATMTGEAGDFTLLGVPPGQYVLKVLRVPRPETLAPQTTQVQVGNSVMISSTSGRPGLPPVSDDPTGFAEVPVSVVDTDVNGLVVSLQRGARLTGRIEFDGTSERPDAKAIAGVPIMMDRADASVSDAFLSPPPGHPDESGAFKTYGFPPGKYLVRVFAPPGGWTVKSIISDGRDVADAPLELKTGDVANVVVTFTDRPTKLEGVARSTDGNGDPDALVVVFPADTNGWTDYGPNPRRMRSVRAQKNGAYTLTGLPPGEYYVAAIKDETYGQWQDPQVLEELSGVAATVRLSDGESKTQDLKTRGGR